MKEAPLRTRVARSIRWSYGSAVFTALVQLVLAAAMARLLDPAAFGLMAVANGVLRYLRYVTDLGIGSVAARAETFDAEDRGALAALGVLVSLVLLAGILAAGPAVMILFPGAGADAVPVLAVMAVTLLLAALGDTSAASLRRDQDFRSLALAGMAALVVGQGLVALPLAMLGWGVWALVAGALAQTGVTSLLLLKHRRLRLGSWRSVAARAPRLLELGRQFMTLRMLDAAFNQIPPLAVGLFAGLAAAGHYDRAFVLAVVPLELINGALGRVLAPAFGSLGRDNRARLAEAFLGVLRTIPCLTFPLAAGIVVAAPVLTRVVLGPGWEDGAPLMALLALWAALRSVSMLAGGLVETCGSVGLHILHRVATILLLLAWLAWAEPATGEAVLAAYAVTEALSMAILLALAGRAAGIRLSGVVSCLVPACLPSALVMAAAAAALRLPLPPAATLVATIAACAVALALGLAFNPSTALRRVLAERVLGDVLAVPGNAALRRWLAR